MTGAELVGLADLLLASCCYWASLWPGLRPIA